MKRVLTLAAAVALVLGTATAALAAGYQLDLGARAMGMAGAFVAVADDGTAAYWNPAGITQIKVVGITPSIGVNGDFTIPSTSIGDQFPPDLGNLDLQLKGMAGVVFKGIGLSLILDANAFTYYDDSGPIVSSGDVEVCGTGMLTLAHQFTDVFAVGVNIKGIYGKRLEFDASGDPAAAYYQEDAGTGYAADVGVMFKAGKLVRIGAVVENAYGTINWEGTRHSNYDGFSWTDEAPAEYAEDLGSVLHVGLAVKPPVAGTLLAFQLDKPLDGGLMTYRIGIEQSILVVKLRAGAILDDGFGPLRYTAGLGFKLGPVVLDLGAVGDQDLTLQAAVLTAGFTF